jgi:Mn2+/Fe2+ NRAMP family transporter
MTTSTLVPTPPTRWREVLKWLGPGWVFAACMIGTGELILTTRAASLYQWAFLWCVPLITFCKAVATSSMLRYGAMTGRNFLRDAWAIKWLKWVVPYCLIASLLYLTGIGAHLGITAGTLNLLFPASLSLQAWIAIVVVLVGAITLLGVYGVLEKLMMAMTLAISVIIVVVVVRIFPPIAELAAGLIPQMPPDAVGDTAFITWIGLLGWLGAGWGPTLGYTWWAEEKGVGMFSVDQEVALDKLAPHERRRLKGWLRPVYLDLSFSYLITFLVSSCLYIAGATVLYPRDLHPSGLFLVETLSTLFTETIGPWAYYVFLVGAFATLFSSVIGVVDGLSRSIRHCLRIMWPARMARVNSRTLQRVLTLTAIAVPLTFLLVVERPIWLLLLSSMLFAPAIGIIFLASTYLSLKLPPELRPNRLVVAVSIGTALLMITTSLWQLILQLV